MRLVGLAGVYIEPDSDSVAWKGAAQNGGILCGSQYRFIFVCGLGISVPCCAAEQANTRK